MLGFESARKVYLTLTSKYQANALSLSQLGGLSPVVIASMPSAAGVEAPICGGGLLFAHCGAKFS